MTACVSCRPGSPCERHFRQQVLEYARLNGWHAYFTWTSIHSPAGFPDLVLVRGREMVMAELKSAKGKPTPAQEEWLNALQHVEMVNAFYWKPEHWPLIEEALKRQAP